MAIVTITKLCIYTIEYSLIIQAKFRESTTNRYWCLVMRKICPSGMDKLIWNDLMYIVECTDVMDLKNVFQDSCLKKHDVVIDRG